MSEFMEYNGAKENKIDKTKENRDKQFAEVTALMKSKNANVGYTGNLELDASDFLYIELDNTNKIFTMSYTNYSNLKNCHRELRPQLRSKKFMFYWDKKIRKTVVSISGEKC